MLGSNSPPQKVTTVPDDAAFLILRPLLEGSPVTTLLVDPERRIVFANHGPSGEPGVELLGRPVEDLVGGPQRERLRAACAAVLKGSPSESFELAQTEAGERWLLAHASPVRGEGAVEAVTLMLVDVTAQKREEERLRRSERLMVDAQGVAHMGTWEWDPSQPHAWWSPELYRIYGLTPETYTPSYEGYLKMVHPDDRQRVIEATEGVFKRFLPYSHDERIFRPDGTMRFLHTWAYPILDERGALQRLVGVCQDVTDFRRAEGAMRAQTMTRAFARRLVLDLVRRGSIPERALRDLGRSLIHEQETPAPTIDSYVTAFEDMGLGRLRYGGAAGGRHTFVASDLLERRADSTLPTCSMTLGYLEGVASIVSGRAARGNEMRCQSMGHAECVFVVMATEK